VFLAGSQPTDILGEEKLLQLVAVLNN